MIRAEFFGGPIRAEFFGGPADGCAFTMDSYVTEYRVPIRPSTAGEIVATVSMAGPSPQVKFKFATYHRAGAWFNRNMAIFIFSEVRDG